MDKNEQEKGIVPDIHVQRIVSVIFHKGCEDIHCKICFANNDVLAEVLEAMSDRGDLDLLGHYHGWLSKNNINPETEHGWWSKFAFDPENVRTDAEI